MYLTRVYKATPVILRSIAYIRIRLTDNSKSLKIRDVLPFVLAKLHFHRITK